MPRADGSTAVYSARRLDGVAGATEFSRCPPGGDLAECESDGENLDEDGVHRGTTLVAALTKNSTNFLCSMADVLYSGALNFVC